MSILQLYHIVHELANIWWKLDANRTDFERAVAISLKTPKRVSCNLNLHITVTSYLRSLLCLTPPPFFWILITSISLGYTPPHAATRLRLYSVYKLCTTCSVNYIQCSQNQIGISQCDCKLVYWYFFIMGDYPVHVKTNCTQWLAAWLDLLLWVNVLWLDLDLQEMTCDFTLT